MVPTSKERSADISILINYGAKSDWTILQESCMVSRNRFFQGMWRPCHAACSCQMCFSKTAGRTRGLLRSSRLKNNLLKCWLIQEICSVSTNVDIVPCPFCSRRKPQPTKPQSKINARPNLQTVGTNPRPKARSRPVGLSNRAMTA